MPQRKPIKVPFGQGMATAGDPAAVAAGFSEVQRNLQVRQGGRLDKRLAWKSESFSAKDGFIVWRDFTNDRNALATSDGSFYIQASNGTWGAATATGLNAGVQDYTNMGKRVYWISNVAGDIRSTFSYDGTTTETSGTGALGETISGETVCSFQRRLFLGNISMFVWNRLGVARAYGGSWTTNLVDVSTQTITGATIASITPQSSLGTENLIANGYTVPSGTKDGYLVYLAQFKSKSATYDMPLTISIYLHTVMTRSAAVVVGTRRRGDSGTGLSYRYRVITAGTTGAGAPAFTTAAGSTFADGTATWVNDGPMEVVSQAITVPSLTKSPNPTSFAVEALTAACPTDTEYGVKIKFGNESVPTGFERHAIEFGFKDATLSDGDPRKANFGQQLTVGRLKYPFFNVEMQDSAALKFENRILWCETDFPKYWRMINYVDLTDEPGKITVIRPHAGRLIAFMRTATFVYQGTARPNEPLQKEQVYMGVGCLGTRAIEFFEGAYYFIGEHQVYRFVPGSAPEPIVHEGLIEDVMARGADWVEDQATDDKPLIAINEKDREIWVYTQKAKIWVYSLDRNAWWYIDVIKDSSGGASEIVDMIYYNSRMHLIARTNGFVKQDSATTQDQSFATGSVVNFNVPAELWLHQLELPQRDDLFLEEIGLHNQVSATQSGSTFTAAVSFDGGVTFPRSNTVTIPVSTGGKQRMPVPLQQTGNNLTVKLTHDGLTGPTYFNILQVDGWVQQMGPEQPDTIPAQVSSSL